MPHLTIEYSKPLASKVNMSHLLKGVHESLDGSTGIEMSRLKSRLVGHDQVLNGASAKEIEMIHVTLAILSGRDIPTKQGYADAILKKIKQEVPDSFHEKISMTVEIRDMDADTYRR